MKLKKVPVIPNVTEIGCYKLLLIKYCGEDILRWMPLVLGNGIYSEHSDIEREFREELNQLGLEKNIEKIEGDCVYIYSTKKIDIQGKGSFKYRDADCSLIKNILESEYPDYKITIKGV